MSIKKTLKLTAIGIGVVIAGTLGISQGAMADQVVTYTLSPDVVRLVSPTSTTMLTSDGQIITSEGTVVGVIDDPSVTVVREVPTTTKVVRIAQKRDELMAASLYNRIAALKDLTAKEFSLGHIPAKNLEKLDERLSDIREDLHDKIDSGDHLTYEEAIDVGEDLDSVAQSLKRANKLLVIDEYVLRPMVVAEPSGGKRLSIFTRSVTKDGVTTTTKEVKETSF